MRDIKTYGLDYDLDKVSHYVVNADPVDEKLGQVEVPEDVLAAIKTSVKFLSAKNNFGYLVKHVVKHFSISKQQASKIVSSVVFADTSWMYNQLTRRTNKP